MIVSMHLWINQLVYKSHIEVLIKIIKEKKIQDFRNNIDRQEKNMFTEEITENNTQSWNDGLRKFLMDKDFQINQINIKIQIKIIWIINTDSIPIQNLYGVKMFHSLSYYYIIFIISSSLLLYFS